MPERVTASPESEAGPGEEREADGIAYELRAYAADPLPVRQLGKTAPDYCIANRATLTRAAELLALLPPKAEAGPIAIYYGNAPSGVGGNAWRSTDGIALLPQPPAPTDEATEVAGMPPYYGPKAKAPAEPVAQIIRQHVKVIRTNDFAEDYIGTNWRYEIEGIDQAAEAVAALYAHPEAPEPGKAALIEQCALIAEKGGDYAIASSIRHLAAIPQPQPGERPDKPAHYNQALGKWVLDEPSAPDPLAEAVRLLDYLQSYLPILDQAHAQIDAFLSKHRVEK
jgi:hypothetical protein